MRDNIAEYIKCQTAEKITPEIIDTVERIVDSKTRISLDKAVLNMRKEPLAERFNEGKPEYSQLGLDCLEPCVRALEHGARKHTRSNWRKGFPETGLIDSLLRHISALLSGEIIDPESGVSHIGHIQANAMFLGNKNNIKDLTGGTDE